MYSNFLSNELKKSIRDPLMVFMLFYPILFGIIGRYLMPWIADSSGFAMDAYADLILVALTLLTPQIYGALVGFSILDDRDDHVLTSIRVTPLSIHQFLSFRLIIASILCFIACTYVLWFSNIGDIGIIETISIAFLASLSTPMTGLIINALAQNKIEGFAVMKGAGIIIVFPIIALFFIDKKELLFSFAPGFWPAKMISSVIRGEGILLLRYTQYFLIGLVYMGILNIVSYKFFLQKTKV